MYVSKPVPSMLKGLTDPPTPIPVFATHKDMEYPQSPKAHPCLPDLRERIGAFFDGSHACALSQSTPVYAMNT